MDNIQGMQKCCKRHANTTFKSWCETHKAKRAIKTTQWFTELCAELLPNITTFCLMNRLDIRFVNAPQGPLCEMTSLVCPSCEQKYSLVLVGASLLEFIWVVNMTGLSLTEKIDERYFVRHPSTDELAALHKIIVAFANGQSPGRKFNKSLSDTLKWYRQIAGIHLNNLIRVAHLSLLFFILHELGHSYTVFSPRVEINLELDDPNKKLSEARKKQWRREITADIDGAFLLFELFRELACRLHGYKPSVSVYAAKMAFGAAFNALDTLHWAEIMSTQGKIRPATERTWEAIITNRQWSRHPPFMIRMDYLRSTLEHFSKSTLEESDLFEYAKNLHLMRKSLFDDYSEWRAKNEPA
ncbi:hypothetical protein D3C77_186400 [compost metagenome]